MIIPFSIRHKKLLEKDKLRLSFNIIQRRKILYLLEDFNEIYNETTETNWNYEETSFQKVYIDLKKVYGYSSLKSFINNEFVETTNLEDFLLGTKPENFIDSVELFMEYITEDNKKQSFTKELNQILKIEEFPIRMMDGEFFRLDSEFAESEILSKTNRLLKEESFEKANTDFIDARKRLSNGDYSGCIISANNSIESYLKKLLDKNKENQGSLKKSLMKSGIIPDYFNGFLDYFEGILQASFTIANKSSRHGQKELPSDINKVDEPIASFCLNLVGTLIIFITERYVESKPKKVDKQESIKHNEIKSADDLPF